MRTKTGWKWIPAVIFPQIPALRSNVDYVREIIRTTTGNTQKRNMWCRCCSFRRMTNSTGIRMWSIRMYAAWRTIVQSCRESKDGAAIIDMRCTQSFAGTARDRRCDNTQLARDPAATPSVHTDMRYQHRRVQLCDQYGMRFRDILTKQDGKKSL